MCTYLSDFRTPKKIENMIKIKSFGKIPVGDKELWVITFILSQPKPGIKIKYQCTHVESAMLGVPPKTPHITRWETTPRWWTYSTTQN